MANKEGKVNKKVKTYLKGQPVQTKLQSNKMKLAALTKKLKTRKDNRERYQHNKQFLHHQKVFYSTLRTGGEGVQQIDDPPKEEEVKQFWTEMYSSRGA